MQRLKLTVNAHKTRLCRVPHESFDFLGYPNHSEQSFPLTDLPLREFLPLQ